MQVDVQKSCAPFGGVTGAVLFLVLFFCLGAGVPSLGQGLSDEQAREQAKASTRKSLSLPTSAFFNAHRAEDLEESAYHFENKVLGQSAKGLYIFSLSDEGYEITSKEILFRTADDGHVIRYVGVARSTGETYHLYGFKDAVTDFGRMAEDLRFHVGDESDARLYALFYFRCIFDPEGRTLIYSGLDLKHGVEDFFYGHSPSETIAQRNTENWWRGFKSKSASMNFSVRVKKADAGFLVRLHREVTKQGAEPEVEEYLIQVFASGQCKILQIRTVYPT